MATELEVDIALSRGISARPCACEACGTPTEALIVVDGCGQRLAEVPVCDRCQEQLDTLGVQIDGPERGRYEAELAAGRSDRLARRIARRWGGR